VFSKHTKTFLMNLLGMAFGDSSACSQKMMLIYHFNGSVKFLAHMRFLNAILLAHERHMEIHKNKSHFSESRLDFQIPFQTASNK